MTDYIHVFLCASAGLLAFFESCGENSPFVRNYHRITEYESFFFFFFSVLRALRIVFYPLQQGE